MQTGFYNGNPNNCPAESINNLLLDCRNTHELSTILPLGLSVLRRIVVAEPRLTPCLRNNKIQQCSGAQLSPLKSRNNWTSIWRIFQVYPVRDRESAVNPTITRTLGGSFGSPRGHEDHPRVRVTVDLLRIRRPVGA